MRRTPGGTELDVLNEWLNVLQSVQIPFALLPVRFLLIPFLLAPIMRTAYAGSTF